MATLPEPLQHILSRIRSGVDRNTIAIECAIHVASLDQRFRRYNYYWNPYSKTYQPERVEKQIIIDGKVLPKRALEVLVQCRSVKADHVQIAKRLNFRDVHDMHKYMEEFGVKWANECHRYVPMSVLEANTWPEEVPLRREIHL